MEQVRKEFVTDEKAKKIALHVSGVSVAGNVLLSLFKLLAGIIGHSGAMISDAVHSASDVFGTIIAVLGISISKRKSDANHQYGHDRLECVAACHCAGCDPAGHGAWNRDQRYGKNHKGKQ